MDFITWLAFVITYAVVSAVPGPSVLMVTSQAMTNGRRAAFLCILGDVTGGVLLIALSLFGLGAIIGTSAVLYEIVKWAGVIYIAWLGIQQIRQARRAPPLAERARGARISIGIGFLTGVLNPKAITFYTAFLAQFIDPAGDAGLQFMILTATSTVVVGGVLGAYALAAARARDILQSPAARRRLGYAGGGCLIGGSAFMAVR
ncbi:MAG: LysE family translocator [Pseudomonadota bacterium]